MVLMRASKSFEGPYGPLKKGAVADVPPAIAQSWVAQGIATQVTEVSGTERVQTPLGMMDAMGSTLSVPAAMNNAGYQQQMFLNQQPTADDQGFLAGTSLETQMDQEMYSRITTKMAQLGTTDRSLAAAVVVQELADSVAKTERLMAQMSDMQAASANVHGRVEQNAVNDPAQKVAISDEALKASSASGDARAAQSNLAQDPIDADRTPRSETTTAPSAAPVNLVQMDPPVTDASSTPPPANANNTSVADGADAEAEKAKATAAAAAQAETARTEAAAAKATVDPDAAKAAKEAAAKAKADAKDK